ncbi:MAG TPA: ATP-binding protein, partial [Pseudonocardiaceae bacterium]|nr:ATP-binding protein [Pseudonocardiaceae bacterium]
MRTAVRRFLATYNAADTVAVACSGGADSLALAAATVHSAGRLGLAVHGLVVDHQLQPGSARVAQTAAQALRRLGATVVRVLQTTVDGPGGPEAAARRARYATLRAAAPAGALVLLGHTLDDQAETVLLGLGRGSGPRSIAGMRELDPPWGRPLLGVRRAVTAAACAALDLVP